MGISPKKGVPMSDAAKKKMSDAHKGKPGVRKGMSVSDETKKKISATLMGNTPWNKGLKGYKAGEEHYNWKGGKKTEPDRIRYSPEYKIWRFDVFQRDWFTCQTCGDRGGRLQAHHIVAVKKDLSRILDVGNGITLCYDCHLSVLGVEEQYESLFFGILERDI